MEEQEDVSGGFSSIARSDKKIVGEKRSSVELDERHGFGHEIRHLDPMLDSETTAYVSKDVGSRDSCKRLKLSGGEMSQVAGHSQSLDEETFVLRKENEMPDLEAKPSLRRLDLNTDACLASGTASNDREEQLLLEKRENDSLARKGIGLDLNADAFSSSVNDDSSVCSSRRHGNTKSKDVFSECGSSNVPAGEKDPMKLWKAMKQNGFLSYPHGGISVGSSCFVSSSHGGIPAPRKRGRKSKNDPMKRKMELARKEEVDRFAKLAAPSGLLNGLNPGIINHVRNKKQVLSIIENLVKSERDSGNFHQAQRRSGMAVGGSRKNLGDVNADGSRSDCSQAFRCFMPMDKNSTRNVEQRCGDSDLSMVDAISEEENTQGLKVPPSAKVSENVSSLSAEESADFSSASVLTVKAATVASQWLELLHQDIKGRLSALRRSKKRVRAVIGTELPFLIVKEFPSAQENDPNALDGVSSTSRADMHKARWMALFNQMDQTLSEEEKQLESWLSQVRELQLHCDQGLQHLSLSSGQNFLQLGMPEHLRSTDALSSEKELAVRAAAASIYSTCNFLMSKENLTCT